MCNFSSAIITHCIIKTNISNGDGGGIYYCGSPSSSIISDCMVVENIASGGGGGIFCYQSSPNITGCSILGNTCLVGGGGVGCHTFSSPEITNCVIAGNEGANGNGGGVGCWEYSEPIITNCTITGNVASNHGGGIYCWGSSSPIVVNSILWSDMAGESEDGEIYVDANSSLTASYSNIQQTSDKYSGDGNINDDPLFIASDQGNYYLTSDSPCIDKGTFTGAPSEDKEGIARPQGAGIDIGAYEYVDPNSGILRASFIADQTMGTDTLAVEFDASSSGGSKDSGASFSWDFGDGTGGTGMEVSHTYNSYGSYNVTLTVATESGSHEVTIYDLIKIKSSEVTKEVGDGHAYSSIQDAINDAEYGEYILVHDGTYVENLNFLGKTITVRSENGAALTIIDGNAAGSVVSFNHGEGQDSVLDGFTLQDGLAPRGGGIACYSSSPSVINCLIKGNVAQAGGGIHCNYSKPFINNCAIVDNFISTIDNALPASGGGINCIRSSPTIANSVIKGNLAPGNSGGGIYCFESSPYVTECSIMDNFSLIGGGLFFL